MFILFFFFQAEDGIRDSSVTGVQTCALPIYIPNVSESALRDLDESGIVRIGATVKQGDILVGKVTPKGETQLTPEEKLLRAIFGEKAGDVRDASLKTPPGIEGTVVDVKIFSRKGVEKDLRAKSIEEGEIERMSRNIQDEIRIITDARNKRIAERLADQKLQRDVVDFKTGDTLVKKGEGVTRDVINRLSRRELLALPVDAETRETVRMFAERAENRVRGLVQKGEERREDLQKGDELPPGVIKMIKVYVAMKRKLSVVVKNALCHVKLGVLTRILPQEDMPYMPDGTPVEIVLNPLGVPSRMNVGQVLETHLGWAAKELGNSLKRLLSKEVRAEAVRRWFRDVFTDTTLWNTLSTLIDEELLDMAEGFREGIPFATPVFDGARETEIRHLLEVAGLPHAGKINLYDGMTGDMFDQPVPVGYIYMLELSHFADDKSHAHSIAPYSPITHHALGGK